MPEELVMSGMKVSWKESFLEWKFPGMKVSSELWSFVSTFTLHARLYLLQLYYCHHLHKVLPQSGDGYLSTSFILLFSFKFTWEIIDYWILLKICFHNPVLTRMKFGIIRELKECPKWLKTKIWLYGKLENKVISDIFHFMIQLVTIVSSTLVPVPMFWICSQLQFDLNWAI